MKVSIVALAVLLASLAQGSDAFVAPGPRLGRHVSHSTRPLPKPQSRTPTTKTTQLQASIVDAQQLTTYFLETVISSGVPALFTVLVVAFAASAFRQKKDPNEELRGSSNPVAELYNDLYGDSRTRPSSPFKFLPGPPGPTLAQNTGVPTQQFIKITNRNARLDSYQYSMDAATKSKALAASEARSRNFDKALQLGIGSSVSELSPSQKSDLLKAEQDFLKRGSQLQSGIAKLQAQLTKSAIESEMQTLGMSSTDMDPDLNNTVVTKKAKFQLPAIMPTKDSKLFKEVNLLQGNLMRVELDFVQNVVSILGPERANGVKAALLGDVSARGAGGLLSQLQDRPLTTLMKDIEGEDRRKNIFVTEFPGDATASQVSDLREEVTAIVRNAKPGDEALVVLQTGGGTVTGYGLAAAQLKRFKENGMKLTICVEQVAASGGYMMTCVADRIIASPFAVLGSIGVISDIPNVYQRLKNEGIEFQTITAGRYKRTITPTKKVMPEDIKKSKEDIEEILKLFKSFVKENRPILDIEKVATGETWFGTDALELKLCDEIKTADDVITEYIDANFNVFDVKFDPPPEKPEFTSLFPVGVESGIESGSGGGGGLISRAVRWLARTVAAEFVSEMNDLNASQRPDRKYMIKDDSSERIRLE